MPRFRLVDPILQKYCAQIGWWRWLVFWSVFVFETLTSRRLSRLVAARAGQPGSADCNGLENLPATGYFVLAVNHYRGFLTLDVIAAVLSAANLVRPDLVDNYLLITGRRAHTKPQPRLPARLVRRTVDFAIRRWANHVTQIALGNSTASIQALRDWYKRVQQQAVLVFPEGKARLQFGPVRTGVGRWLTTLHTPIVPVGVWWCEGSWHLRFGPPLRWSHRPELRDVQLGLAIATLLPPALAPDWQAALAQWQAAHQL